MSRRYMGRGTLVPRFFFAYFCLPVDDNLTTVVYLTIISNGFTMILTEYPLDFISVKLQMIIIDTEKMKLEELL